MKLKHIAAASLFIVAGSCFAGTPLKVSREAVIEANAETVWKVVGNFNALDFWHPLVMTSTMKGNGVKPGATRQLTFLNGAEITEKLTAYDNKKLSYTYKIIKTALPVSNYVSTISLSPTPEGKTLMKWESSFEAKDTPEDEALALIQGAYDAGLKRVGAFFMQ